MSRLLLKNDYTVFYSEEWNEYCFPVETIAGLTGLSITSVPKIVAKMYGSKDELALHIEYFLDGDTRVESYDLLAFVAILEYVAEKYRGYNNPIAKRAISLLGFFTGGEGLRSYLERNANARA
jgi:hypothetical protein